jgi:tetratricopeptide (TPR) repeat protein
MKRLFNLIAASLIAISGFSQTADEYLNRGLAKYSILDYTGAINDYNKAIEINPEYAQAIYYRGIAKYELKDYKGAIRDYTRSIEINPNFAVAFYNRGITRINRHDSRGAISDYTKAIEINNAFAEAYYLRGMTRITDLGQKDSGCTDLSKAGELGFTTAYEAIKKYCNNY